MVGKGIVGRMKVKKEGRAEAPLHFQPRLGRPWPAQFAKDCTRCTPNLELGPEHIL